MLDLTPERFRSLVDRVARLAGDYLDRLDTLPIVPAAGGAELAAAFGGSAPEQGRGEGVVDLLGAALLECVNRHGQVYLSNATLGGALALRACFVNHRTTDADVAAVVKEVLAAAGDISDEA